MRLILAIMLMLLIPGSANAQFYGGSFGDPDVGDVFIKKHSFGCQELDATPSSPIADQLKFYCKDDAGTTKLYTLDSTGTETELGAGGGGTNYWSLGNVGINTTNNVGIGSVSPTQKLDIEGTAQAHAFELEGYSSSTPVLFPSTDTNTGVRFSGPDIMQLETGGSAGITITSAQNVGVGTSVVNSKLAVNGGAVIGTGYMATVAPSNGLIVQGNVGIGTTLTTTAGLTVMSGNVGIGTWAPAYSLEVLGTVKATTLSASLGALVMPGGQSWLASFTGSVLNGQTWTDGSQWRYGSAVSVGWTSPATTASQGPIESYLYRDNTLMLRTNSGFIVDSNVGIGTVRPVNQLVVNGGVGIGTANSAFVTAVAPSGGMIVQGNVGIGTTTPRVPLDVYSPTTQAYIKLRGPNSGNPRGPGILFSNSYWNDTATNGMALISTADLNQGGSLLFSTTNESSGSGGTPSEKMRITSAGNVGIGTTNPGKLLDVAGDIRVRGVNSQFFGDDNKAFIQASATTTPDIKFLTNSTEIMRITNGGSVSIGSTVSQGSSAVFISNSTANNSFRVSDASGDDVDPFIIDTAGNVAIGSFSATSKLLVSNETAGNSFRVNDAAGNDESPFLVDTNGNVAVGTFSAGQKLEVFGNAAKLRMYDANGVGWNCGPAITTGVFTCT